MSRERQTLLISDTLQVFTLVAALFFIVIIVVGCASPMKVTRGDTQSMGWHTKTLLKF